MQGARTVGSGKGGQEEGSVVEIEGGGLRVFAEGDLEERVRFLWRSV